MRVSGNIKMSGAGRASANRGGVIWKGLQVPIIGSAFSGTEKTAGPYKHFNPFTQQLTINDVTVSRMAGWNGFDYIPADGDWPEADGTAAGLLELQTGSADSGLRCPVGTIDRYVRPSTARWRPTSTSFANIETQDFAILLGLIAPPAGGQILYTKSNVGAASSYSLYVNATMDMCLYITDGTQLHIDSSPMIPGAFYQFLYLVDRNSYVRCYNNGAANGVVDFSGAQGSLSNSEALTLAAYHTGTAQFAGGLLYLWIYKASGAWFNYGSDDGDDAAKEIYQRWGGILPTVAPDGDEAMQFTRSSAAYFHRRTGGASRPNEAYLGGGSSIIITDDGVPAYNECVSRIGYSLIGGPGWTTRSTCTATGGQLAPDGSNTAYLIEGCNAFGTDLYRIAAGYANDANLGLGFWIKRSSTSGQLGIMNASHGQQDGDTRVTLSSLSDEWEYFTVAHPAATSVNPHTAGPTGNAGLLFWAASGGPLDFYVWQGIETESSGHVPVPGSPVHATAGNVETANEWRMFAHGDVPVSLDAAGCGTVKCVINLPNDTSDPVNKRLFILDDSGSANRIDVYSAPTTGYAHAYVSKAGVAQFWIQNTINIRDGNDHEVSISWREGRISFMVDGTEYLDAVRDNEIPTGLINFRVGCFSGTGYALGGHIKDMVVSARPQH